ncbi:uncharacterized protein C2845_PM13G12080 [Panicum miliaceum]|uniref:Uncharacterized protein n=1 Tax=Panicum miliaceum TaxID=4540 RepID=A0A3L6RF66_PANMI|nr:uncharacterized protein C2845_PM13G12080 [Panicum miliaceum]
MYARRAHHPWSSYLLLVHTSMIRRTQVTEIPSGPCTAAAGRGARDPADGRLHSPREFGRFADVATVLQLQHHRRIREQLRKISHRYRKYIVSSLILVSASQFAVLLSTTRPHAVVNLATAGELAISILYKRL